MAIKYKVLRMGDRSDRGPGGEFGIVVVGENGDKATGETVYCLNDHRHSKACAQAALDAKTIVVKAAEPAVDEALNDDGTVRVPGKAEVPAVMESPRERIQKWHAAQRAEVAPDMEPLPKVEREVVRDGKRVREMVENRDLS